MSQKQTLVGVAEKIRQLADDMKSTTESMRPASCQCERLQQLSQRFATSLEILEAVANAKPGSRELMAARLHAAAFVTSMGDRP